MSVNLMLLGAISLACFIASLFFMRFWRVTRDRFFLFFAISFCIEGLGRLIQGFTETSSEEQPIIYLIRVIAFLIILFAIVDKNRTTPKPLE
jgi:uncharacterized membrane protein HdeD (DUF308 family)